MSGAVTPDGPGKFRRLTHVSRAFTNASSLDNVLTLTVECAQDFLAAEKTVILLNDADGMLRVRAARGIDEDILARFREPLDETLVQRLEALFGAGARNRFTGVPLVVRGRVFGLLAVDRGHNGEPTEDEEWLLSALADQASIALDAATRDAQHVALEQQLAQLTESRANTQRALQIAGHDLRTPLNAMQGYVELLRSGVFGPVNDRQAELLDRVQVVGRHFQSLLENVLEMARLANGEQNLHIAVVPLTRVIREASMIVTPAAKEKGVNVECVFEQELSVKADPDRLRQVLLHLLDNAVKYTPAHSSVTVTTGSDRDHGCAWGVIKVQDAGPGIPHDMVEEVFVPYRRLYTRTGGDPGGTGLGLSIARSLAELMGGSVTAEPKEGPGATFCVRLPLAD